MPRIESWRRIPAAIRDRLVERMRDRNISVDDLNQLRVWLENKPDVPTGTDAVHVAFEEATGVKRLKNLTRINAGKLRFAAHGKR